MTVTATPSPRKTEAWVPQLKVKIKRPSKSLDETRPLTATLERPLILDIALLKKLDMTTFTKKGLVTISKLCGVSLIKRNDLKRTNRTLKSKKHLKRQSSNEPNFFRVRKERLRKSLTTEISSCDDESTVMESKRKVQTLVIKKRVVKPTKIEETRKANEEDSWLDEESSASDVITKKRTNRKDAVNNLNRIKDDRLVVKSKSKDNLKRNATVDDVFSGPLKNSVPEPCKTCGRTEQPERFHSHPKTPSKVSESQKPNKPSKTEITKPVPAKYKSAEKGQRASEKVREKQMSAESSEGAKAVRPLSGRPRTITCYLCAREFGTASFPLHENRCKEKWERENAQLPLDMRRKLPEKPNKQMTVEEWNEFAWKVAQESLVPCKKCGRTFNPDRIQVHLKACKEKTSKSWPSFRIEPDDGSTEVLERPATGIRPPTVICYICGREFGSKSIGIHEPQCLKKWNVENDKLPEDKRRPEPIRPATGDFDAEGTFQSIWANHMDSLIPCSKCGRRFFPDRIERHVSVCNNQPVNQKQKSPKK